MSERNWMRSMLLAGVACGALTVATGAAAQTVALPSDNTQEEASSLDEIVVTARRREERLQDVPVAVTALTNEALRQRGVTTTQDLQTTAPSLRVAAQISNDTPSFSIRGQGRPLFAGALPAVVTYLSDVPLPQDGSIAPVFDIGSVQVLKGPQGTLFGRNTTGGAVLIYPSRPEVGVFEGYVEGTLGNYDLREVEAVINLPFWDDRGALRLAGEVVRRDGFVENLSGGRDLLDRHANSFRASLLLRPTDTLENLTTIDTLNTDEAGGIPILTGLFPGGTARSAANNPFFFGGVPGRDLDIELARQRADGPWRARPGTTDPYNSVDIWGLSNTTTWEFGELTFRNIFGYRNNTIHYSLDVDGTSLSLNDRFNTRDYAQVNERQYSNEFQVLGKAFDDRLDWIAGLFYLDSAPDGSSGYRSATFIRPTSPPPPIVSNYVFDISKAVFAQGSYDLSDWVDGLGVTLGYRYTWDERSFCGGRTVAITPLSDCDLPGRTQTGEFSAPTWTATVDYRIDEQIMVYASTRRGYRSGGLNLNLPAGLVVGPYQPELSTDFELGLKSDWRFGDARARFNAAAYRTEIEDFQQSITTTVVVGAGTQTAAVVLNAAKAHVNGAEIEAGFIPNEWLELNASYAWLDPQFDEYTGPPGIVGGSGVLTNQAFPGADQTFNLNAKVNLPVPARIGDVSASVNWYWSDDVQVTNASQIPDPLLIQPAYSVIDLRLDWRGVLSYPVDLGLFARNVTDEDYRVGTSSSSPAFTAVSSLYGAPRTVGVELRYSFGQ